MKKVYPKKEKAAYVPRFVQGELNPEFLALEPKTLNRANFMTKEQEAAFVPMTRNEYEEDRRRAQLSCKSW